MNEIDYATLMISVLAIGLSVYSLIESRRNNRITHRPAIVGHEAQGPNEYSYRIINKGNGPAFFKSVEWFLDKKPLGEKTFSEVVKDVVRAYGLPPSQIVTTPGQKSIMGTGEAIVLGAIAIQPEHVSLIQEIQKKGFGVRIVYESAFGEEFVFVSDDALKNI